MNELQILKVINLVIVGRAKPNGHSLSGNNLIKKTAVRRFFLLDYFIDKYVVITNVKFQLFNFNPLRQVSDRVTTKTFYITRSK